MRKVLTGLLLLGMTSMPLATWAAIGCTLSNPARDLKSLFPTMTSYREDIRELAALPDGKTFYEALKTRVGDLDPVYEGYETPYTLYSVFEHGKPLGFVHGVNVPGRGGVIQVFVAVDPASAAILKMFYQRLESPGGSLLRAKAVRDQFVGLTLADFYKHDYFAVAEPGNPSDRIARLAPPVALPEAARPDWAATLRGLRKNLILLDLFAFERRHEPFYQRAGEALKKKEKQP